MKKKGFTLVEIMVVLAVSALVMLVVTEIFLAMHDQKSQLLAEVELQENLSRALEKIGEDIRYSDGVAGYSGEYLLAHELTLYTWVRDGAGRQSYQMVNYTIAVDPVGQVHPFKLSGYVLYRKENQGQNQPIANFIDQLTFAYYDQGGLPTKRSTQVASIEITLLGRTDLGQVSMTCRVDLKKQEYRVV